jgi:hypothetical protein
MPADPRRDPCDRIRLHVDETDAYWGGRIGGVLVRVFADPPGSANFDIYIYRLDRAGQKSELVGRADHWLLRREATAILRAAGEYEIDVLYRAGATRYVAHAEFIAPEQWTPRIAALGLGLVCNTADQDTLADRDAEDQTVHVGDGVEGPCEEFVGSIYSHDGLTLSANVFLPTTNGKPDGKPATGPRPTVLKLVGGAGGLTAGSRVGSSSSTNPFSWLLADWHRTHGYVQASFSRRGASGSCGLIAAANNTNVETASGPQGDPTCDRGWTWWRDRDMEGRDAQHFLGTLVDFGIADPDRLGAIGQSMGGGYLQLIATSLPWPAPYSGQKLQLAAAVSWKGFSDLHDVFAPNGRQTDDVDQGASHFRPYGLPRDVSAIPIAGPAAAERVNLQDASEPRSHVTGWTRFWVVGEPYDESSVDGLTAETMAAIFRQKSAYHADEYFRAVAAGAAKPVPLYLYQGYRDQYLKAVQALQLYRKLVAAQADYPVWLHFDMLDHAGSEPLPIEFTEASSQFLVAFLSGGNPPADRVVSYSDVRIGPPGGPQVGTALAPQRASSWDTLKHEAGVVLRGDGARTTRSGEAESLALWTWQAPLGGFTMLGLPALFLDYEFLEGESATLFVQLSDIGTDGTVEDLGTREYRLAKAGGDSLKGKLRLKLDGPHAYVAPGHTVQLELSQYRVDKDVQTGWHAPTLDNLGLSRLGRPDTTRSTIRWLSAKVEIPTVEDLKIQLVDVARVSGHGALDDPLDMGSMPSVLPAHSAKFHFAVNAGDPPIGTLTYMDDGTGTKIKSNDFTLLQMTDTRAVFGGTAEVDGAAGKPFTVEIEDNDQGATGHDMLTIRVLEPGGYTNVGSVTKGDIRVEP